MSDGLVQFLHRRVPPTLEEREAERLAKAPFHKYRRFTQMPTVSPDDLVVQEDKKVELVSKKLNHFGVIAGLFRQIGGHSSRFVLFYFF